MSESFEVKSSSVLAPSWATEGRMQTGGAGTYCHKNISGLPSAGLIPRSSQSVGVMSLNRFKTLSGFRSSMAFFKCLSSSAFVFFASAKDLSKTIFSKGITFFAAVDLLYARNLS